MYEIRKRLFKRFTKSPDRDYDVVEKIFKEFRIIQNDAFENIRLLSEDYPHIYTASKRSSEDVNKKYQVVIKGFRHSSEFMTEVIIMNSILKLGIPVPIPRLYGVSCHPNSSLPYRVIMEKINTLDLMEHIEKGLLDYNMRLKIIKQLVILIYQLHENNIVHRDIKCDNILVSISEDGSIDLTIIDFAYSMIVENDKIKETLRAGTRQYYSPELYFKGKYLPKKNDVWSIGVIIYILLSGGYFPFEYDTNPRLSYSMFYHRVVYNMKCKDMDVSMIKILRSIFNIESKRITIKRLMKCVILVINELLGSNKLESNNDIIMTPKRRVFRTKTC